MSTRTGLEMKLYRGAKDAAVTAMTEVVLARNVTPSGETDVAQFMRRGQRWKRRRATLSDLSIEIELEYEQGHADYEFFRDAWLNGTTFALAALSDEEDETGAEGPYGNFSITSMSRPEQLTDSVSVTITCVLDSLINGEDEPWHETGGT